MQRAQNGAEQLLAAAGLGEADIGRVAEAIVKAAHDVSEASRGGAPARPVAAVVEAPQTEDPPPTPAATPATPAVSEPAASEGDAETEPDGSRDSP